ncbi:MAG TPA: tripartite tricarboxylate transporter substrate binding protein [Burkholderiales bacterium]|nr:tripartite tricarboxylate transporter substrate binding protein [Burkholderiales bacterium]
MTPAIRFLAAAATLFLLGAAQAQSWPTKPVKMIVPATPGGTIDPLTRVVADALSKDLGHQFVVENRPGAQGNTGLAAVAKADPDGYTLGIAASSMLAINPHLYKVMPYDPLKDLAPIALVGDVQNVLVVHPSIPATTLKEFTDYVNANPGKLNFGSSGNGSSMHLSGELYKKLSGTQMQHVPYANVGEATKDLVAGRTQLMFQLMTGIVGQVKAGNVRPIVVLSDRRSSALPDVPTTVEAGMPQLQSSVWFGIVGPQGTPNVVVDRVNAEVTKLLADPAFRKRLNDIGAEPFPGGPAEFTRRLAEEYARWGEVVKLSGARIE